MPPCVRSYPPDRIRIERREKSQQVGGGVNGCLIQENQILVTVSPAHKSAAAFAGRFDPWKQLDGFEGCRARRAAQECS